MSHSINDLLKHIQDEIDYLIENSIIDEIEFSSNPTLQRAFVRSLEIIGEAVKKLPQDFKDNNNDINWKDVAGMRDVLIHEYFGIDYEIVWSVIKEDIPELKRKLKKIISN
jgi:uncharacterized protein with HEPN domain